MQYQNVLDSDPNYAVDLASIFKYAVDSFNDTDYSLSFMFASEIIATFGEDYSKDIMFMGHSCGGFMSTATSYMLQLMYHSGKTNNKHLVPARLVTQDPYVNGLGDAPIGDYIMGTDDEVGDRGKCEIVQDMMISLHKYDNVAIEVYIGMTLASNSFIKNNPHFNEVKEHVVTIDMTGLKKWQGSLGNIHVMTRDWCWASMLEDKLTDQNGDLAPSCACTNEEILSMVGKLYQQNNAKWDFSTEGMTLVEDTSGFKL